MIRTVPYLGYHPRSGGLNCFPVPLPPFFYQQACNFEYNSLLIRRQKVNCSESIVVQHEQ